MERGVFEVGGGGMGRVDGGRVRWRSGGTGEERSDGRAVPGRGGRSKVRPLRRAEDRSKDRPLQGARERWAIGGVGEGEEETPRGRPSGGGRAWLKPWAYILDLGDWVICLWLDRWRCCRSGGCWRPRRCARW